MSERRTKEGRKVLVFKTPKKDFACETFVIKDYKKFNGEEKEKEKGPKNESAVSEVLTVNVTQHSVSR